MSLVSKLLLQLSLMFVISTVAFGQNSKNEAKKLFDAGGIHLSKGPVSYTHLTLPTIYSV